MSTAIPAILLGLSSELELTIFFILPLTLLLLLMQYRNVTTGWQQSRIKFLVGLKGRRNRCFMTEFKNSYPTLFIGFSVLLTALSALAVSSLFFFLSCGIVASCLFNIVRLIGIPDISGEVRPEERCFITNCFTCVTTDLYVQKTNA